MARGSAAATPDRRAGETLTHRPGGADPPQWAVDSYAVTDIEDAAPSANERDPGALPVPGGSRARAEEWALVLAAEGLASQIRPRDGGYELSVAPAQVRHAQSALEAYQRENAAAPADAGDDALPLGEPGVSGVVVAFLLLGAHLLARRPALRGVVYDAGSANARAILDGEWWRTVTALFLHADLGHVVANALFGVYFVTAVTRSLGVGLGLALVLAAGALGNALNAIGHAGAHDSIGASTAVFGAIGVLAGMALARRNRSGLRGARLLVPVGAGLALLAMLGTSGARVDVFAHLYGLLAGGLLGIAAGLGVQRRPGPLAQTLLVVATAGLVIASFGLALRG